LETILWKDAQELPHNFAQETTRSGAAMHALQHESEKLYGQMHGLRPAGKEWQIP